MGIFLSSCDGITGIELTSPPVKKQLENRTKYMEQLLANIGQQVKVHENKYLGLWAEYLRGESCVEKNLQISEQRSH